MRTRNSIVNTIVSLAGQVISLLISFASRKVFIYFLGETYLGLNGLFLNILSVLSLVEIGIGPAIIFSLYKPLAENDLDMVQLLMKFYKKSYTIIGILVGILGIATIPLLPFIIKEMPQIPNISFIFLLFVLNSSLTYFFSYKRSLIVADQKQYISSIYRYVFHILMNVLQIIVLCLTHDYLLYLFIQIISSFCENVAVSNHANKLYPFLKKKNSNRLDPEMLRHIFKNTSALIFHKIGSIVVNATDNIIIAAKVSIISVGYYSNYQLIFQAVKQIISQIFLAVTASVGNVGATESKEKMYSIFKILNFLGFWIFSFSSICLYVLFNPFISLAFGDNLLFPMGIVSILVFNYYITGMRQAVLTFRDALGLYWYDRYKPIFEVCINLAVSLLLVKRFGISGVFIGTAVSTLTTCFWVEPFILYKYAFKRPLSPYFIKYGLYTFVTICLLRLTNGMADYFFAELTWSSFIARVAMCLVVPNVFIIAIFFRTSEFQYLYQLCKEFLHNLIKRIKK